MSELNLKGRFFSQRDLNLINSINGELISDIIETEVELYKVCPTATETNIYGETAQATGRYYYPPINISAIIDRGDITSEDAEFGPDRNQGAIFNFREKSLQLVDFYPEIGDLILFNERYYEIDNVVQEQFLGGNSDKSLSIICNTHYTRFSKVNIIDRQL